MALEKITKNYSRYITDILEYQNRNYLIFISRLTVVNQEEAEHTFRLIQPLHYVVYTYIGQL